MEQNSAPLASKVGAITLFVSDLARSSDYYRRFLRSQPVYEDKDSTAFRVGETIINLLRYEAVPELVQPAEMAKAGLRMVCTLPVSNVDTAVEELSTAELTPVNGPIDRPWGIRTANYADPDGYLWELSCDIG